MVGDHSRQMKTQICYQSPKLLGSSPPILNNRKNLGQTSCEYPIYRQNPGWSAKGKIPDRLMFSRHMKTRLNSASRHRRVAMAEITVVVMGNARMLLGWLFQLGKHAFSFRHFTVKKARLPMPSARLCCFMLIWMQYVKRDCGKNVSLHRNFLYTAEK